MIEQRIRGGPHAGLSRISRIDGRKSVKGWVAYDSECGRSSFAAAEFVVCGGSVNGVNCEALAEEALAGLGQSYIWRLRIPFDEVDNPRNYLSKVQRYPKVYDNVNSISHRADFVRACLDLWGLRAPRSR